ncbi:hypothetical protein GCM10007854_06520 [Algimonas porphyrae]|uniref:Type II secretion system protein N n=1 Tax=Algimonas porphyrae TaxID=1128113 RepID=A0ABQ5UYA1_9PROT|nr:hypothetical protein GCM10007854_06520 [Algimonas porphyrae]
MNRRLIILVVALAGVASLIQHAPLAWVDSALPDGFGPVTGTYWNGQIDDVPLLGDVSVDGRLGHVQLATAPGEVTFRGDVSPTGVTDLVLSMPIARLPISDARLSGLVGRVSLQIDEAVIEEGACVSAVGHASTDVLSANRATFDWYGPELAGPVDCIDGRLRVRLSGQEGGQNVSATILTGMDGTYRSDISVVTADPMAGNALALFGFGPDGQGGYSLSEQGRWR